MNILGKTAILGLSVTCLVTTGSIQIADASTVKVTQYKNLKTAKYIVVKGSKGFLYKDATLKHKLHSVNNYSKVKFVVSKEAIVRQHNGDKAAYYRVKSSKISGWIWNGYLAKISPKSVAENQIADLHQQIVSLQMQVGDLKNQLAASSNDSTVGDSALKIQINTLQNQLKNMQNETSTNSNTTDDPWSGKSDYYYLSVITNGLTIFKDNQADNDLVNNKGVDTSRVITNVRVDSYKVIGYKIKIYPENMVNSMYPCEYNGIKGYIRSIDVTLINADESVPQILQVYVKNGLTDYYSNVAPTDPGVNTGVVPADAGWIQYTSTGINSFYYNDNDKQWERTADDW